MALEVRAPRCGVYRRYGKMARVFSGRPPSSLVLYHSLVPTARPDRYEQKLRASKKALS